MRDNAGQLVGPLNGLTPGHKARAAIQSHGTDTLTRKRSPVQVRVALTRQGKVPIEAMDQRKGRVDPG
jgi:hypothetical protein